ncbi:DUF294 nucleotidyltransferase-like domain-containing protein [Planctobacterium marinum]|uniref:Cyclic nucleotide-binding protein n=1 Tax=Planctobacterium marinum TaxID=1631968 RepID=A0AA48KT86_9ALTE|nr:cyclic nucleotide-binding protein [Planctobacterium marinum]
MSDLPKHTIDFFTQVAPWDSLSQTELSSLIQSANLVYLNEDSLPLLDTQQRLQHGILLIQSGEFEVASDNPGAAPSRRFISESEYVFLHKPEFLSTEATQFNTEQITKIHTPGLVFCLDIQILQTLAEQKKAIKSFFIELLKSLRKEELHFSQLNWQEANLFELCQRDLITVTEETTIAECAQIMSHKQVSSVLVCQQQLLSGILTDKDLRSRVLAKNLSAELPVKQVMTVNPEVAYPEQDWLDAVCLMSEQGFSHVPIVDRRHKPLGIMTKSDVINQQKSNIAWLIKSLSRADNLYELIQQAWQIPHYIRFNMQGKQGFATVGQWLARATDVMTRRLIQFYVRSHGPAPMAYCWLVYGSQARKDQLLTSDQDNGLLLADSPDVEQAVWFKGMGEYVCNGLAKCGISLCNGNIMASNPELRCSLDEAIEEARRCVTEPNNDRLLHFNIFLDVRLVEGNEELFSQLQSRRAELFKQPLFLAALAREVNSNDLPLNLFQRFVYEEHIEGKKINLKVKAVAVVNSIVRLYSLAQGIKYASTPDRLAALSESGMLAAKDCANLKSIWFFLNELRLTSQLNQTHPDNLVDVTVLSPLEKYQLKKALQSIKRTQSALLVKFSSGLGG